MVTIATNEEPVVNVGNPSTTAIDIINTGDVLHHAVSSIDPIVDGVLEKDRIKSIADFLMKPIIATSGSFTVSNVWGDSLFRYGILDLISLQPIWLDKLSGFLNWRGTVKLRLVINPTPFQAGLLRMQYYPCGNLTPFKASAHLRFREGASQLPGVWLPLSRNAVELSIPYVAPTPFIQRDLPSPPDFGTIDLKVFEILRTGTGPSSVQYSLWMSIEDLELSGQMVPQSSQLNEGYQPRNRNRRRPPSDNEANGGKGTISAIFDSGVVLSRSLATIPSLTPMLTPVTWALKAASGAAQALGWSKPLVEDGPVRTTNSVNWYMINSNSNDTCQPVSLMADNKLTLISDASEGNEDEMAISYIKSKWSYCADFAWLSTSTARSQVFRFFAYPFNEGNYTVNGQLVRAPTPVSYLARLFDYYRGSLEVRIRLVKTGYHTGALAFSYLPGNNPPDVLPFSSTSYIFRHIVDIQDGEEFCFRLPYLLTQEYRNVESGMGALYVHVVNPLLAPDTVAPAIDVLFEVRGGADLEFQVPKIPTDLPFLPQGAIVQETGENISSTMGASKPSFDTRHSELTIGEHVTSVLQLVKASSAMSIRGGVPAGTNFACYSPHRFYGVRYDGTNVYRPAIGNDLVSFIAATYAFSRGSERVRVNFSDNATGSVQRFVLGTGGSQNYIVNPFKVGELGQALPSLAVTSPSLFGPVRTFQHSNYTSPIQAPFYNRYKYMPNDIVYAAVPDSSTSSNYKPQNSLYFNGNLVGGYISRSVGEDWQFAFFVGCIPLVSSSYYFA